ncbi:MAG: hypothetical protein IPP87_00885 [Ideonella sp.]|nr:hypothetical protein [Ideonella sp.]MBL0147349.1 hypothetical protein [Ideonella sp.]
MNTIAFNKLAPAPELVDFVDLKWLMACEGRRVDLSRLQTDAAYARQCLALASASPSAVLRQLAVRLAGPAAP